MYVILKKIFNNLFGKSKKSLNNSSEISSLREKYIGVFEKETKKSKNPWKSPEELSNITKTSISDVNLALKNSEDFIKNSKGLILTRKKYEEITPLWKKIVHSLRHQI